MSQLVVSDLDFNSSARILNLPDPVSAQQPATKAYVDSAQEGLAWKESSRVATQANINLASPGATIDGVTMATNDRVLVRNQTTASQNGIYIWNGAAVTMTRAPDANTAAELEQATVSVEEGSDANTTWRQSAINFTLESGSVTWTTFATNAPSASETTAGIAEIATQAETDAGTDDVRIVTPLKLKNWSAGPKKFQANIGDGSATQFTVTHNLNTRDVLVQVVRNSGNFDTILVDAERTSVNAVRITFASAPTANQFRVLILG